MRLTRYTDYSLRALMHLAVHDERLCSIGEIAAAHDISQNHLMKVVNALAHAGFVETVRGRGGGIRLGRPASEISVGEVVRYTEENESLAECGGCVIAPACGLAGVLAQGMAAMLSVFDSYTLADLVVSKARMGRLLARRSSEEKASAAT